MRLFNRTALEPARRHLRTHGTAAEATLWRVLKGRAVGGHRFRRQFSVGPHVLDFYCPRARLAVEVDGAVHDAPGQRAYDAARDEYLAAAGIRVVHVPNRAVFDGPEAVRDVLSAALASHADFLARSVSPALPEPQVRA